MSADMSVAVLPTGQKVDEDRDMIDAVTRTLQQTTSGIFIDPPVAKPLSLSAQRKIIIPLPKIRGFRKTTWTCSQCSHSNVDLERRTCSLCGNSRGNLSVGSSSASISGGGSRAESRARSARSNDECSHAMTSSSSSCSSSSHSVMSTHLSHEIPIVPVNPFEVNNPFDAIQTEPSDLVNIPRVIHMQQFVDCVPFEAAQPSSCHDPERACSGNAEYDHDVSTDYIDSFVSLPSSSTETERTTVVSSRTAPDRSKSDETFDLHANYIAPPQYATRLTSDNTKTNLMSISTRRARKFLFGRKRAVSR